ncbi:unnamed protein product [Linum trigynum]
MGGDPRAAVLAFFSDDWPFRNLRVSGDKQTTRRLGATPGFSNVLASIDTTTEATFISRDLGSVSLSAEVFSFLGVQTITTLLIDGVAPFSFSDVDGLFKRRRDNSTSPPSSLDPPCRVRLPSTSSFLFPTVSPRTALTASLPPSLLPTTRQPPEGFKMTPDLLVAVATCHETSWSSILTATG